MKKILLSLFAVLGLVLGVYADVTNSCKISGGQDGATVIASVIEVGDGYVNVDLANDGNFAVNVKIDISGKAHGSRGAIVDPQTSKVVKVPVPGAKSSDNVSQYNVRVSGSRCN